MFTTAFLTGAAERALKTFAQALLAGLVITAPIVEQPWLVALGVAASAAVFSILTSIGASDFTAGTPRTVGATIANPNLTVSSATITNPDLTVSNATLGNAAEVKYPNVSL